VTLNTPEWELGELAVRAVRLELRRTGYCLLPVDHLDNGGPPVFITPNGAVHPAPDILAARQGQTRWIEVKWKTSCVLYQKAPGGPKWRHGIDVAAWRHYLWIVRATGLPGGLAIVQLRPGPNAKPEPYLLTANFEHLEQHTHPHIGGDEPKVWWDVDVFRHYPLRNLSDDWRRIELGPRVIHPWEGVSKLGVAPRWNPQ
jgi:hypothetical protein